MTRTDLQTHDIIATLIERRNNVVCPVGWLSVADHAQSQRLYTIFNLDNFKGAENKRFFET